MDRQITLGIAAALLFGATVSAHHSEAGYDSSRIVAFEGTVTHYGWRNPHVYINVATVSDTGEPVEWLIETGATPIMVRSGWSPESLAPGDRVAVRGHPDKRPGQARTILLSITKEDGTVLAQVDGTPEQPRAAASGLAGVWSGVPQTIGPFYRALNETPLTPAGEAARAQYDYTRDSPVADCVAPPAPDIIAAAILYLSAIEITEPVVRIRSEFFDAVRTVHMDDRSHPAAGEPSNQGHSIGRWEGGTLVVDTTQFAAHPSANGQGVPSSSEKHMIERYTLSEDGARLVVDVLLEDPVYLAEPFSGQLEWQYSPSLELQRYNCDPEISRVFRQQ